MPAKLSSPSQQVFNTMRKSTALKVAGLTTQLARIKLLSTRKHGVVTEVWKGSQHLGDFSSEGGAIQACRYVSNGHSALTRGTFKNESQVLYWMIEKD